jgi:hypothetical protein
MAERIIFTVEVFGAAHESRGSELAHIAQACNAAQQDARAAGGAKLSGVVLGDGAVPIGRWKYEPNAEVATS